MFAFILHLYISLNVVIDVTCNVLNSKSFAADPVAFCTDNPLAIMAHPDNCARYIDCTLKESLIGQYQHECRYPDLFDSYNNSCKSYREVNCGTRPEPKAPCKYCHLFTTRSFIKHESRTQLKVAQLISVIHFHL